MNNSQFIESLPSEPAYMYALSEMLSSALEPSIVAQGASVSDSEDYPEHNVQAGTFFRNIDLDDQAVYDSMRAQLD